MGSFRQGTLLHGRAAWCGAKGEPYSPAPLPPVEPRAFTCAASCTVASTASASCRLDLRRGNIGRPCICSCFKSRESQLCTFTKLHRTISQSPAFTKDTAICAPICEIPAGHPHVAARVNIHSLSIIVKLGPPQSSNSRPCSMGLVSPWVKLDSPQPVLLFCPDHPQQEQRTPAQQVDHGQTGEGQRDGVVI